MNYSAWRWHRERWVLVGRAGTWVAAHDLLFALPSPRQADHYCVTHGNPPTYTPRERR